MRSSQDEARSPKYAHVERERRWLVEAAHPAVALASEPIAVVDRYIRGTRLRLRQMTDASGTGVFKLTKKYECTDPLARPIVTAYLSSAEAEVFVRLAADVIVKQRLKLESEGLEFTLDRFGGPLSGLVLAEIEQTDEVSLLAIAPPEWALREVSDDLRYQGGHLAALGLPAE